MRFAAALAVGFAFQLMPAFGQELPPPPYLDDRSTAESLVQSYYNAVWRREYARAWDYFGDDKPSQDFAAFAAGYDDTHAVRVATGIPSVEGAAGSTIYEIPVSIEAYAADGSDRVFAGCFTLRQTQPANQDPPFSPMEIVRAQLSPSDTDIEAALPPRCGTAPLVEVDKARDSARKQFVTAFTGDCESIDGGDERMALEESEISYRATYSSDDEPLQTARLFRFFCGSGAYNEVHVYYLATDGQVGLVQFADPELDIRYVDDNHEGAVESVTIIGYTTEAKLVNSFYDPASQSITSFAKWRGIGDASSTGQWMFRNGTFTLVRYQVDASYDGEMNDETVLDFHTGP